MGLFAFYNLNSMSKDFLASIESINLLNSYDSRSSSYDVRFSLTKAYQHQIQRLESFYKATNDILTT